MRTLSLALLLFSTALPLPSLAAVAEGGDDFLHVARTELNTTQEQAEYCLGFDRNLDMDSLARASLRLESDRGGVQRNPVSTIIDHKLCLSQLDYRAHYRLSLAGLLGAGGETLATPYKTSFFVPERQAALAIAAGEDSFGWQSWPDRTITLRSINIGKVGVELYRLNSDNDSLDAWCNRSQALYAPNEGAYFAQQRGQLVWQGVVDISGKADVTHENTVVLDNTTLPSSPALDQPGLYFIVVKSADVAEHTAAGLTPIAGSWLLRSALRLRPYATPEGVSLLAVRTQGQAVAQLSVRLYDNRQKQIAETVTDAEGYAHIPSQNMTLGDTYTLVASTATGDRVVQDILFRPEDNLLLPRDGITFRPHFDAVSPGNDFAITLASHDNGKVDGILAIIDQAGMTISKTPVAVNGVKPIVVSAKAPTQTGVYSLVWLAERGHELARRYLRVSNHPSAPVLSVVRKGSEDVTEGGLTLNLRATEITGKPAPFRSGTVKLAWAENNTPYAQWRDYRFGAHQPVSDTPNNLARFITNAKGEGGVALRTTPPAWNNTPLIVHVSLEADAGQDMVVPATLSLPMPVRGNLVGIKPKAQNARFAENSIARFSVITVAPDGRRVAQDNLSYQVYAEGRSFDWQVTNTGWDFRALPAARRLGGKSMSVAADKDGAIEWPVTSGLYRLDILNDQKRVVASQFFSAGVSRPSATKPDDRRIEKISLPAVPLRRGVETVLKIQNTTSGTASLIVADDRIRILRTIPMTDKVTKISLRPANDWGRNIRVVVDDGQRRYETTLSLEPTANNKTLATDDIKVVGAMPAALHDLVVGDQMVLRIPLRNAGDQSRNQSYDVVTKGALKQSHITGNVMVPAHDVAYVGVPITALTKGNGQIVLTIDGMGKTVEPTLSMDVSVETERTVGSPMVSPAATAGSASAIAIKRRYFSVNGKEVAPAALQEGKSYIVILTLDNLPKEGLAEFTLSEISAAGLQPVGCAVLPGLTNNREWGWLAPYGLVDLDCRRDGRKLSFSGKITGNKKAVSIAYGITASNKGSFTALSPNLSVSGITMPETKVVVK